MMILLGLSIGLALSLILAIYVIMSPSPFVDKFGVEINSGKNSETDQSKMLEENESSEFYDLLDGSDNDMSNNNDFLDEYEKITKINKESLEKIVNGLIDKHKTNFKGIGQPLRVALTGSKFGPGLYNIILSLDKNETIKRLKMIK